MAGQQLDAATAIEVRAYLVVLQLIVVTNVYDHGGWSPI
jgi:hypothetical protein